MRNIFLAILIFIYSFLFEFIGVVLSLLSILLPKKNNWHVRERRTLPNRVKDTDGEVGWIHAASLGEAKIIIKILSVLQEKKPENRYVLTAVTESGVNYLKNNKTDQVCAIGFMPLDTKFLMKKLIKSFAISRVWLVETEIWPAMLWTCLKYKIPIGVVNARLEETSFKIYSFFLWILKPFFSNIDVILAQDNQYAIRFKALGVPEESVHLIGNIKSYISINSPLPEKRSIIRKSMKLRKNDMVITVGCIHPDETIVIRETIAVLNDRGYSWKWVVVPRHLNKSQMIKNTLGNGVIKTQDTTISSEWDICVIDKFGVLEDMYAIADAAIIGGTFNTIGGHNLWEAVQYSIPVFFGPDYHTQQESCKRVLDAGVAFCVNNFNELADGLIKVTKNKKKVFTSKMATFKDTMNRELSSLGEYF